MPGGRHSKDAFDLVLPSMPGYGALESGAIRGWAYFAMMTARPQALGYGLTDSPADLAGWPLVHGGFARWTYGDDPGQSPTKDGVLDDFTLYWLTNTATSSARLYWENRGQSPTSVPRRRPTRSPSRWPSRCFPARAIRRRAAGPPCPGVRAHIVFFRGIHLPHHSCPI